MRLLIVSNNMHIGGVQKALVDLLWNIQHTHDVTLLLFNPSGAYMKDIPENVKVLGVRSAYKYLGMTKSDVCGSRKDKLMRSFFAAITRVFGRKYAVSFMALGQKKISGYDVAVSYLHNGAPGLFMGGCNDFVLRHTDALRKITFLHCDYSLIGADTKENKKQYAGFDTIAACSEGCRASFTAQNPELSDKTLVVTNFHRFDVLKEAAKECPVSMSKDKINILTVARLGKEKGVSRGVRALCNLKTRNFHYYVIGDGIERGEIERYIKENSLSELVTMCGELSNPYGYMQSADLLLIPSISEAAPIVIDEAASLGTPVLSTKTSSAVEMITDRDLGWVCENSENALTDMLCELLSHPDIIHNKKKSLKERTFDNKTAITQLESVLGN